MVELKFKPKGTCLKWRLKIRNGTQQGAVLLLLLLLMTHFQAWIILTGALNSGFGEQVGGADTVIHSPPGALC